MFTVCGTMFARLLMCKGWKMSSCCYVTCCCMHDCVFQICVWSDWGSVIQSRLCLEQLTAPTMCVCVWVCLPTISTVLGKFVSSCGLRPCVSECTFVCVRTWFHCTFVCGVYSVVGKVNSPVIPPHPAVFQQLLKAFSEGRKYFTY